MPVKTNKIVADKKPQNLGKDPSHWTKNGDEYFFTKGTILDTVVSNCAEIGGIFAPLSKSHEQIHVDTKQVQNTLWNPGRIFCKKKIERRLSEGRLS